MNQPTERDMAGFFELELTTLKKYATDIAGEWNGKESGRQEIRAELALDIVTTCDALIELLQELYKNQ